MLRVEPRLELGPCLACGGSGCFGRGEGSEPCDECDHDGRGPQYRRIPQRLDLRLAYAEVLPARMSMAMAAAAGVTCAG